MYSRTLLKFSVTYGSQNLYNKIGVFLQPVAKNVKMARTGKIMTAIYLKDTGNPFQIILIYNKKVSRCLI